MPVPPPAPGTPPAGADPDTIRKTAHLARLDLTEGEVAELAPQFARILDAFRELSELDVAEVEPMTRAVEGEAPLRADEPGPCLERERLLAGAPEPIDGFFGVPRTIEGEA